MNLKATLKRKKAENTALPHNSESRPSLDGPADAIVSAVSSLQTDSPEPVIRVYLDGKLLSDAVTKYQRRDARALG